MIRKLMERAMLTQYFDSYQKKERLKVRNKITHTRDLSDKTDASALLKTKTSLFNVFG